MTDAESKFIWVVELWGIATTDVKRVEVAGPTIGSAMTEAVRLHPTYRVRSVHELPAKKLIGREGDQ